ncbi:MAG: hypothetical protein COZ91_00265 [Candidatus Nealsonbacteria bacterium CG_4_8_14_3_um_filter_39_7]|uniref:Zinc finger DksA/TraR C4-type domain-containing protein n=1 Tax=Candidatus Nealsonbacteria bacterium CG23_combo_of_CG06-09_8_20_14_all_39_17 TaxID=1974722 RepID=A0A2G9YVS9_9BACT|nr:MAG: hypothetical protein COX37_03035 [Candidatus Nealsonbacteria bacterium CG23_combo_of_CG06-09_8_20_14_all_39_17]PIU43641.1 MAG: hypothetical protein COS96_03140 [Candidatus Nealsonbacteria bacterium CG07_land_8_20_14_0_80_39_13]PIW91743.1 MAG: hypothetical protein COZ91_00265 [Candidatus Nealsonbacteria bacterium CG_4_8_14_3_um_filter_39_7]
MKKEIEKISKKLSDEKERLEKELEKIADKNKKTKGDWKVRFPNPNTGEEIGDSVLEVAADDVEEYATLLPIEESLETRLAETKLALNKIKKGEKGKYGICEKCGKEIPQKRLNACPESRLCLKCKKN